VRISSPVERVRENRERKISDFYNLSFLRA
jgi:hypothetical protein